jgi:hypothetical protein
VQQGTGGELLGDEEGEEAHHSGAPVGHLGRGLERAKVLGDRAPGS